MPDLSPVHITTRSGDVRVMTEEGIELSVEGGTVEQHDDGTIHVRRAPSASRIESRREVNITSPRSVLIDRFMTRCGPVSG